MATRCIQHIYDPSLRSAEVFQLNPEPERQGVYQCKLQMTEDKEIVFVEYTKVAMVHMIYSYYGDTTKLLNIKYKFYGFSGDLIETIN